MAGYRVGEVELELEILKAGFRRRVLPRGWSSIGYWLDFLTLGRRERADLKAFLAAGWRFRPGKSLDWKAAQARFDGERIAPGLLARYPKGGLVILSDRLVLQLRPSLEPDEITSYLSRYAKFWKLGFGKNLFEVELELPEHDLEEAIQKELGFLSAKEEVICAEPSLIYHLQPPGRVQSRFFDFLLRSKVDSSLDPYPQWQWEKICLSDAWKSGDTLGKGKSVAVIDLGFHKDLEICPNVAWTALLNEYGDIFTDKPLPTNSHGTFCAGLVGAIKDDSYVNGAAPECKLILVAVHEKGVMSQVALAKALELCAKGLSETKAGADVISCSLGLPESNNWALGPALRMAIDFALSNGRPTGNGHLGSPIVWAVFDADEPILPTSVEGYKPLISVSQSAFNDYRIDSGYGPALDLLAPGYLVTGISWDGDIWGIGDGEGSSLAAPCVAGVAALVLAANEALDWKQVAEVLLGSCDPDVEPKVRQDDFVGWGRLNAKRAVCKAISMKQEETLTKPVSG